MCEGKGLGKVVAAGEVTVFVEWCPLLRCSCFHHAGKLGLSISYSSSKLSTLEQ